MRFKTENKNWVFNRNLLEIGEWKFQNIREKDYQAQTLANENNLNLREKECSSRHRFLSESQMAFQHYGRDMIDKPSSSSFSSSREMKGGFFCIASQGESENPLGEMILNKQESSRVSFTKVFKYNFSSCETF